MSKLAKCIALKLLLEKALSKYGRRERGGQRWLCFGESDTPHSAPRQGLHEERKSVTRKRGGKTEHFTQTYWVEDKKPEKAKGKRPDMTKREKVKEAGPDLFAGREDSGNAASKSSLSPGKGETTMEKKQYNPEEMFEFELGRFPSRGSKKLLVSARLLGAKWILRDPAFESGARALGGQWSPVNEMWVFPAEAEESVRRHCSLAMQRTPQRAATPKASAAPKRTNRRAQHCSTCGRMVPAGEGSLVHYDEDDVDDHLGFGARPGWHVFCRDTKACTERAEKARREVEQRNSADKMLAQRKASLFNPGDAEHPLNVPLPDGRRVKYHGGFTIYGTGEEFLVEGDREHIWLLVNNGADGDDWSRNNVILPGGAGVIGHRFAAAPDRFAFLHEIDPTFL